MLSRGAIWWSNIAEMVQISNGGQDGSMVRGYAAKMTRGEENMTASTVPKLTQEPSRFGGPGPLQLGYEL